jgi:hypothetical protein
MSAHPFSLFKVMELSSGGVISEAIYGIFCWTNENIMFRRIWVAPRQAKTAFHYYGMSELY